MSLLIVAILAAAPLVQDEDEIREWIDQLGGDYEEERVEARKKLEAVKEKAEPMLLEGLDREDFRIQKGCIELLTAAKSEKAVEPIAKIFKRTEAERTLRQSAFDYLLTQPKAAEVHLIDALETNEDAWKLAAIRALTEIRSEKCAEKIAALYDREPIGNIKTAAFDCLQNIGPPAKPYLLKLLDSQDSTVRLGALKGLKNIKATTDDLLEPVAKIFKTEKDDAVLAEAYEALLTAKSRAVPHFLDGLKSAQRGVRLKSILGLRTLKAAEALEPFGELFNAEGDDEVREQVREGLQDFGLKSEAIFLAALDHKEAKVRFASLEALGVIGSEKPYDKIAKMYAEDKDEKIHRKCFDYLKRVPARASKELIAALKDEDPKIREEAIQALGRGRVESAIGPLVELLNDIRPEIQEKAIDSLVRIGAKAVEAVDAAVKEGKVRAAQGAVVVDLFHQESVERLLDRLVSPEGGTGFFAGQFREVEAYGKERVVPILVKIATDPAHAFRLGEGEWKGDEWTHRQYLRELSIMALGDLGDEAVAKKLREAFDKEEDQAYRVPMAVSLHRLGDKAPFAALVKASLAAAEEALKSEDKETGYGALFSVALAQSRVGEREAAAATYERLLKALEEGGKKELDIYFETLYNLACLHALAGRKSEAVDFLSRAVDAGFKDRDWIRMDKELDGIRDEDGYKKLLADEKRFKRDDE